MDEAEVFINLLRRYTASRGQLILGLLRSAGQEYVKIEFHGLYRYYESVEGYPRFMDLYRVLREKYGDRINILGYTVTLARDHILVPRDLIRRLARG